MYNLTERKITIGIYGGIFLIFVYSIRALYGYIDIESISYFYVKQAIMVTTIVFLYLTLLILLYNIVVVFYNQNQIRNLWKWLIKIEVISSVLAILTSLATYYGIVAALVITKLVAIVIYLIIFNRIMKIDKDELPDIGYLQNSVISFYIILVLLLILSFMTEFGKMRDLNFTDNLKPIGQFLVTIPFLFIVHFLVKVRKRIYRNKTASV